MQPSSRLLHDLSLSVELPSNADGHQKRDAADRLEKVVDSALDELELNFGKGQVDAADLFRKELRYNDDKVVLVLKPILYHFEKAVPPVTFDDFTRRLSMWRRMVIQVVFSAKSLVVDSQALRTLLDEKTRSDVVRLAIHHAGTKFLQFMSREIEEANQEVVAGPRHRGMRR